MSHPSYQETTPEGIDLIRWPHKHPLPENEVIAFFTSRGVTPLRWSNAPSETHPEHTHPTQKTLFCIEGEITFSFPDLNRKFTLHFGDRFIVPAGLLHSARVGPEGVVCIEGRRDTA